MATAEFAVAMPALALTLIMAFAAVGAGVTQLRVTEAARVAARSVAMGEDPHAAAARTDPAVAITVESGELTCVAARRSLPGPLGSLGLTAHSRACAFNEGALP